MSGLQIDANNNITNVGYIEIEDQTAQANGSNGVGRLYKKTGDAGIFWKPDNAGDEVNLTLTGGISIESAAVNGSLLANIPAALNGKILNYVKAPSASSCNLVSVGGDTSIKTSTDCADRISLVDIPITCNGQEAQFTGTGITNVEFYAL
jgi:hypothetical protein